MTQNSPAGCRSVGAEPAVSIVIPTYNTAAFIGETLASVFAQTRMDYEVIVVNDGSPDTVQLEQVLSPYLGRINYIKQENRGLGGARNTAIRTARAAWIALLDSDDLWEPNYLAVQLNILESDASVDGVYANAVFFGDVAEAGRKYMDLCPSEGDVTFESLITQRCTAPGGFAVIRREAIMRAGMFDETLGGSEDFDLWLRLVKQGSKITYHRQALVRYRRRGGSLMSNMVSMAKEQLRVLDKALQMPSLSPREVQMVKRQMIRIQALQAFHEGKRAFMQGDVKTAIEQLGKANAFLKSRRMTFILLLLRLAPKLLLHAYRLRDRFIFGANTAG